MIIVKVKTDNSGIIHVNAFCTVCKDPKSNLYNLAFETKEQAKQHCRETGHTTIAELGYALSYEMI